MIEFQFRGLMAPVFTPFLNDSKKTINLDVIPQYAKYLLEHNIYGVLVNGTSGEGMSMSVTERESVVEAWVQIRDTTKQTLMVQVGGAALPDVLRMARHAESLNADALLCLPELYFKPKTTTELIKYLTMVSEAAPLTPLLYYHIPAFTNVNINMEEFLTEATGKIRTLVGIKFTSCNLNEGVACVHAKSGMYTVFLGADQIMAEAFQLGFDSAIATTLNMIPTFSQLMLRAFQTGESNVKNAQPAQEHLVQYVNLITKYGSWVASMKAAMNILTPVQMGPAREPLEQFTADEISMMKGEIHKLKDNMFVETESSH